MQNGLNVTVITQELHIDAQN